MVPNLAQAWGTSTPHQPPAKEEPGMEEPAKEELGMEEPAMEELGMEELGMEEPAWARDLVLVEVSHSSGCTHPWYCKFQIG